jgi:hypothetical protein
MSVFCVCSDKCVDRCWVLEVPKFEFVVTNILKCTGDGNCLYLVCVMTHILTEIWIGSAYIFVRNN